MAAKKTTSKREKEIQREKEIKCEIKSLIDKYGYNEQVLSDFAKFVLYGNQALTLPELKQAIYQHFNVKDTTNLKKSGMFQMATSSMGKFNLAKKDGWESLYRKFIGILPHEKNETGRTCINGINIFKYNMPWKVFDLDPETSNIDDIKLSYRNLSKIYHPDNPQTGDAEVFHRLTIFYESLTERF
jgi:hypothetical protein